MNTHRWTRSRGGRRFPVAWIALGIALGLAPAAAKGDKAKPPPLAPIELPPPPPVPKGAAQALEAMELLGKGDPAGALRLFRDAWEGGVRTAISTYNASCAAALAGEADEAFVWLERAADAGWRDADGARADGDLDSLREDPRFASFLERAGANATDYLARNNSELLALVEADQAARQNVPDPRNREEMEAFWKKTTPEDTARRKRVAEILAAGGARTGDDYYAAALVYQHGDVLDDFAKAREYAAKAVELGTERGRWLAAAAWDRWLVNAGYPQRFGTQYHCDPECRLDEWDPAITDEERARWNVPPLDTAKMGMDDH